MHVQWFKSQAFKRGTIKHHNLISLRNLVHHITESLILQTYNKQTLTNQTKSSVRLWGDES